MPFDLAFDELTVDARATTRGRTITEADLMSFSALTWDHHPVHTDSDWATRTPFGERIAHGMLTVSYTIGLLDLDPRWVVAVRRLRSVVFRKPVRIGDTIHASVGVRGTEPIDETCGLVSADLDVIRQDGVKVVRIQADLLWRR